MRASHEHDEAVALCQWWSYYANSLKLDQRLLIHIPNEGKRTPWGGRRLKDEGLRPGTPDYFLAFSRSPYHGLFIELKARKGRLGNSQEEMMRLLSSKFYWVEVCFGAEAAIDVIKKYLNRPALEGAAPLHSKS